MESLLQHFLQQLLTHNLKKGRIIIKGEHSVKHFQLQTISRYPTFVDSVCANETFIIIIIIIINETPLVFIFIFLSIIF